jgi:hypothetical protein
LAHKDLNTEDTESTEEKMEMAFSRSFSVSSVLSVLKVFLDSC